MLPIINLTLNRNFKIKNFEEDKSATLSAHPGLRYIGKVETFYAFSGNYYLINNEGSLIESFEVKIFIGKSYPNTFPIVCSTDEKITKSDEYHISEEGVICLEHTYIANNIIRRGLRLYDFINYYLTKYFSWVLVKKYGESSDLQEWDHQNGGTLQVYEILLDTTDKHIIKSFLEKYLTTPKIRRNDKCYCGSDKKIKDCHYDALLFLQSTSKITLQDDLIFLNK